MSQPPPDKRPRTFVPVDLLSSLRGPHGWTNRQRRQEGYPDLDARRPIHLGFLGNVLVAVGLYGVPTAGAVVGWQAWGGWLGAGLGLLVATSASLLIALLVLSLLAVVRSRRS